MELSSENEVMIRFVFFLTFLLLFALLEAWRPRRTRQMERAKRWPSNFAVSALNQLLIRLALPIAATAFAAVCVERDWGLLNRVDLPDWLELVIAVLLLDLAIFAQHFIYHRVPVLWRLHRVHHADIDFDVTTGLRFHPVSVLLSALVKLGAVLLLGPAVIAVVVFEVLLNATSLFNHSNMRLHPAIDRILRLFVVTPDMHRVHHSTDVRETNSNFGFNFPWWDRLFRTYRAQPALGHERMEVGLAQFRNARERGLVRLLTQPFRTDSIDVD